MSDTAAQQDDESRPQGNSRRPVATRRRCDQEFCPNWSGDGNVCPCAIFGIERESLDRFDRDTPDDPYGTLEWA